MNPNRTCIQKYVEGSRCGDMKRFSCKPNVQYHEKASTTNYSNTSTTTQLSNILKNARRGNFSRPSTLTNSLGYFEGGIGGSGAPLRNRFSS